MSHHMITVKILDHFDQAWAFYPDPKTRPKTDPKNLDPIRNWSDLFTLLGLVVKDPRVLDPTRTRDPSRVPENPKLLVSSSIY